MSPTLLCKETQKVLTFTGLMILFLSFIPSSPHIFCLVSNLDHSHRGILEDPLLPSPTENVTIATEEVGDQQLFWVLYPSGAEQELATLLSVGTHCYIYMENSCIETLGEFAAFSECEQFREAFDSDIYLKGTELAGNPNGTLGDIDGDPKVTIYVGPFLEKSGGLLAGFYEAMNDLEGDYSNYREMIFIDVTRPITEAICTIIHEFNHLIWFNHEMDEAYFLLEGLANLAIQYTGYSSLIVDEQVRRFTHNPEDSLLFFNRIADNYYWDVSYGQSYLFVTYLYERFGVDFIRSLVSIPEDGAIAIDVALSNGGYNLTFNDVYLDWIVACTLDNTEIYEGIYGFSSVDYTIDCRYSIADYPIELSNIKFNYYGIHARRLHSPTDNMALKIECPISCCIGIAIAVLDDEGWHVTQTLHTENSTEITEHIEGTNVQAVYIMTSLMSKNTPSIFGLIYDLDETPSLDLDYSISSMLTTSTTSTPTMSTTATTMTTTTDMTITTSPSTSLSNQGADSLMTMVIGIGVGGIIVLVILLIIAKKKP